MPEARKPATCEKECSCTAVHDVTNLIVITGGPGAGKTAVLEIIRKQLCEHVVILPESASIIFGGGFWRLDSLSGRRAAQGAILHVQQQMENLVVGEKAWALGLCDRGLLDGLAYWPGDAAEFWIEARTTLQAEYKRYHVGGHHQGLEFDPIDGRPQWLQDQHAEHHGSQHLQEMPDEPPRWGRARCVHEQAPASCRAWSG